MRAITIHEVTKDTVVSLDALPGFQRYATLYFYNGDEKKDIIPVYYSGDWRGLLNRDTRKQIEADLFRLGENKAAKLGWIGRVHSIAYVGYIRKAIKEVKGVTA